MNASPARLRAQDLVLTEAQLRGRIDGLKRENTQSFPWYPYDSLSNINELTQLLGGRYEYLLDAARARGVLDIGCGDGDMAFLFEAMGCAATAIDYPPTNHNGMQGVRTLKRLLNSEIEIREGDLDERFDLPDQLFGLTLFLGILYHLKNPFRAMEKLARHSKYCVISTRVARCFPGGAPIPPGQAIAYLVGEYELNADETNYWIFSPAGLERLLTRTHWEVLESVASGQTVNSEPVDLQRDERIYCLLKSHFARPQIELLEGWHAVEENGWRWTKRRFSARVHGDGEPQTGRLALDLAVPPALFSRVGPLILRASLDGQPITPTALSTPGRHVFRSGFRAGDKGAVFTFELDKSLAPGAADSRELGIVVTGIEVE